MAYNPYAYPYPQGYTQLTPLPPVMPQTVSQTAQNPQNQPQIQNGGFVCLRSIEEARNYPVAPGHSITFKIENQPFLCTKTMGFSQLDQPLFEKYRLIKEEDAPNEGNVNKKETPDYALKSEFEELRDRVDKVEKELREADGV